jgi:protein phosphatase PTC7
LIVIREKTEEEKQDFIAPEFLQSSFTDSKAGSITDRFEMISRTEQNYLSKGSANFKILYKSKSQEHGFNFPFQIGTHGNNPKQAETSSMPVCVGDFVILGTDGLFDNLYCISILEDLEYLKKNDLLTPENISKQLAENAYKFSLNTNYISPFSMTAILNIGTFYQGGKSDDITVSVGMVTN